MFSVRILFLIIFLGLFSRRLESPISDHNSRTRFEVEEVSLYRWNKDVKFFGKHLFCAFL